MEQPDWATQISTTVAGEVRRYRLQRGLSAQQLSDRCAELGLPIPRTVVSNIENGRRGNIGVAEVLILGHALEVPPAVLIFPVGYVEEVEAVPGEKMHPMHAIQWMGGEGPFPGLISDVGKWMHTAMFFLRKLLEGKERLRESMQRAVNLSSEASKAPDGPLREAYKEAAGREMGAYEEGKEAVNSWLEILKDGFEDFGLPPLPHPDVEPMAGSVTVQMVPDILSRTGWRSLE